MKANVKITENYLTEEAIDLVNNLKIGHSLRTDKDFFTIRKITPKTLRVTTPLMMEWRPERKVIRKNDLIDKLESGFIDMV